MSSPLAREIQARYKGFQGSKPLNTAEPVGRGARPLQSVRSQGPFFGSRQSTRPSPNSPSHPAAALLNPMAGGAYSRYTKASEMSRSKVVGLHLPAVHVKVLIRHAEVLKHPDVAGDVAPPALRREWAAWRDYRTASRASLDSERLDQLAGTGAVGHMAPRPHTSHGLHGGSMHRATPSPISPISFGAHSQVSARSMSPASSSLTGERPVSTASSASRGSLESRRAAFARTLKLAQPSVFGYAGRR